MNMKKAEEPKKKRLPPPPVRQTLASKYRMLKGNPLLRYELEKKLSSQSLDKSYVAPPLRTLASLMDDSKAKTITSTSQKKPKGPRRSQSLPSINVPKSNLKEPQLVTRRDTILIAKRATVTPKPSFSKEIMSKLNLWLKRKGKSVGEYQHLKCFGVHAQAKSAGPVVDKENVSNNVTITAEEAEELKDSFNVAQEALVDLHKLISEGYSPDQCEIWLKLIKEKHKAVEEEPQYWECRAALEQTKGNIGLAVECYKTAIIQGAEVQEVDKHLDQLLHKFTLMNINREVNNNPEIKNKAVEDVRNVFKSSIIQFAVQERKVKKKNAEGHTFEKVLFATPVRRSTRLSRSAFTSTPGVKVYSSLRDVDDGVRKSLNFLCNNALKD